MESEHFVGKIALRAVVERDGRVLVCRDMQDDIWEWPGGRLHKNEDPKVALAREFFEELGTGINVGEIFYAEQGVHARSGSPQVFLFYRCGMNEGDEAVPDMQEVAEVNWITRDELKTLPMWEDCRRAADRYLAL